MIGLVIVSHSRKLAEGLKEMADAMTQAPVPIIAAGGMEGGDDLGTDVPRIMAAIREVIPKGDVAVFGDIGSAKLSAEMAIDLLDDDERARVRFCDAPLVEGILAAAVQSAAGGDLERVLREASGQVVVPEGNGTGLSREFTIRNRLGLHARPAALFVEEMSKFGDDIRLTNLTKKKPTANAKSINGVMLSEVSGNDLIRLDVSGEGAARVFAAMDALVKDNFGEEALAPAVKPAKQKKPETGAPDELKGISVARGFAIGPIRHVTRELPDVAKVAINDTAAEIARFTDALAQAEREIEGLVSNASRKISAYDQKIFDAHIAYLRDPDIREKVQARINAEKICAAAVWRDVIGALQARYAGLSDPVLAGRAADVLDVGRRVLRLLSDDDALVDFGEPAILAFDELVPSDVLALPEDGVLGICAAGGGKTSHAGILASGLSVPVVLALGAGLVAIPDGTKVSLEGAAGRLKSAPTLKEVEAIAAQRTAWEARQKAAEAVRFEPARTRDGKQVRVAANMASADELSLVANSGAEEVGLLRTEFLFMRRDAAPSEDEQYETYTTMVKGLDGGALTVRTIDIGGDKPVPYMDRPPEANPNIGWRGLRYSLDVSDLFEAQLAAILRASAHGPVRIMFPLVSTLDEVLAAKAHVEQVKSRLTAQGTAFDPDIEIGIMVEVPAAAEMADLLAPEVDFFSIGTNDLTQYVMASDRANPKVQNLFDPFNPAVLRMVQKSVAAAHDTGIWIGMCGAMAGNPLAAPILLGMGLDEFSMTPADIAEFKLMVKDLDTSACEKLAQEVVTLPSARAVKEHVAGFLAG